MVILLGTEHQPTQHAALLSHFTQHVVVVGVVIGLVDWLTGWLHNREDYLWPWNVFARKVTFTWCCCCLPTVCPFGVHRSPQWLPSHSLSLTRCHSPRDKFNRKVSPVYRFYCFWFMSVCCVLCRCGMCSVHCAHFIHWDRYPKRNEKWRDIVFDAK